MRVLARLLEARTSQTAQGGQVINYSGLGTIWLKPGARRRRERSDSGVIRAIETLTAVTRARDGLEVGQVVRFGGADWDVVGLQTVQGQGGRVELLLERRP